MNVIVDGQGPATHRARRFQFGLASMVLVTAAFATCFGAIRLWGVLSRGPLLPHWLVEFICYVSGFAFFGGIAGTLCGLATGAAIGIIRTRHAGRGFVALICELAGEGLLRLEQGCTGSAHNGQRG